MEGSTSALEQTPRFTFEEQFTDRKNLKTPQGNLEYVQIKPQTETLDTTPILVLPGWAITLNTERPLLEALYDSGKSTIAVEFPRFGGAVEEKEGIPTEVVRQAELIARLISSQPDGTKIDIMGQSMAAMSLLAAVKIEPEILTKIRNVVLVSPAGISGQDNFPKLVSRYLGQHVPQDLADLLKGKWHIATMTAEAVKYIGKNPIRTLKEASAIGGSGRSTTELDTLQILRDNGVGIAFIQGQSDKLTPADKLLSRMTEDFENQFEKTNVTPAGVDPKIAFEQSGSTPSGIKWKGRVVKNHPPVDVITIVTGGHDNRVWGDPRFTHQILKRLEFLNAIKTPGAETSA